MGSLLETHPQSDFAHLMNTKRDSVTGSCIWLFGTDDYFSWKDAGPQTLWINDGAGMGKTMLMMAMIEELARIYPSPIEPVPLRTLAYFFCDRNDPRLRTAAYVARGLLFSLAAHGRHQFSATINVIYQATRGFCDDVNTFYTMARMLQNAMKVASYFGCQITFVVDGLDDCEEGLPQLLDYIGHTITWHGVKWLISSRRRLDVKAQLTRAGRLWDLNLE